MPDGILGMAACELMKAVTFRLLYCKARKWILLMHMTTPDINPYSVPPWLPRLVRHRLCSLAAGPSSVLSVFSYHPVTLPIFLIFLCPADPFRNNGKGFRCIPRFVPSPVGPHRILTLFICPRFLNRLSFSVSFFLSLSPDGKTIRPGGRSPDNSRLVHIRSRQFHRPSEPSRQLCVVEENVVLGQ